jgi:hypothetical protein
VEKDVLRQSFTAEVAEHVSFHILLDSATVTPAKAGVQFVFHSSMSIGATDVRSSSVQGRGEGGMSVASTGLIEVSAAE